MRISRLLGAAALVAFVAAIVLVPAAPSGTGKFLRAPVFNVGPNPVTEGVGEQLMESLNLQENPYSQLDGALRYLDPSLFAALPTSPAQFDGKDESGMDVTPEALDETAAPLIDPPSNNVALDQSLAALTESGLMDDMKTLGARATIGHARFQSIGTSAGPIDAALDTEVLYRFRLDGRELLGPAAKARISFSGDGEVSQLLLNFPSVAKGDEVRITTAQLAQQSARKQLNGGCGNALPNVQLSKGTLVYYAPTSSADTIFPWWKFDGTIPGQFKTQTRTVLVPAVLDGAVKATASVRFADGVVSASVKPRGGTPPYSYQWSSCSTPLDPAMSTEQSIQYRPLPRSGREALTVLVTDANGLTARAFGSIAANATNLQVPRRLSSIPRIDAGIEWIGNSGGLPGSAVSAAGFVGTMTAFGPVPIQFNWGDLSAWERDFKDPSKGGQDSSYVDDVDLTFYTGHAGDWGWWFSNTNHDDQNLTFNDAFLGDRDLEWLGIAACGPLQLTGSGLQWWQRWGPAFQGLHLLMGYATTSFDNTIEGPNFARYILGIPGLGWLGFGPVTVRQAWAQMAIDAQPSSVTWAEMGVYGPGGVSNWNDYFWGRGPTGPDIPHSQITGYWRLSGPS